MPGRIVEINLKPQTGKEWGIPKLPSQSAYLTQAGLVGEVTRLLLTWAFYRTEKGWVGGCLK
jgi:hypothetical protein